MMFAISWNVKGMFFLTVLPACVLATLQPISGPILEKFLKAVGENDGQGALMSFLVLMVLYFVALPVFSFTKNFFLARYVSQLGSWCRMRMLNVMMKGGTEYSEVNRGGKLSDAFSNQLT